MKHKQTSLIILLALLATVQTQAQTMVHGVVKDRSGKALQSANVLLLKAADSSLVKGAISDAAGRFVFENVRNATYIIAASYTGLKKVYTRPLEITAGQKETNAGTISLNAADAELKDVTVTVRRPMFEQKVDRMVINVKNSITNVGGTALDVLEKSPGVTVNRQNNSIAINGKNGVVVMLNGKISYMPLEALVQMLSGISAGNIDKIELITTPPAKYDAGGNAGYINIVLLNNPDAGLNGSYFITGGWGRRPLAAGGMNFNYRSGKVNLYGSYAYTYDHTLQGGTGYTQLPKGSNVITNTSYSNRNAVRQAHNARAGIDYQMDSNTVIGALISGYNSMWKMTADNGATVHLNGVTDTTISTVNKEINHWQNLLGNLNFQHTFKPGKVIYFDVNYIYYKDNNPNTYTNNYFDKVSHFIYSEDVRSGKVTPIKIGVLSTDYTTAIGKKITVETGAKVSLSKFTNDVSVNSLKQNTWVTDTSLSAFYLLKENIAAAYTSLTISAGGNTTIKAGLRYEHTTSNLGTTQRANIVDRKYGQFFPTFYISQKLNENNSINFSYNRRITRPTFNDLAPFTIFFDPKTFFTGNPALQPAISNSVQASYVYKNFIFTLSYTHEKNSIEGFQTVRVDSVTNILYVSAKNFNYEQYASSSLSLPVDITKWWNIQNNINLNWRQVNTTLNQAPVQLQLFSYDFNITQRFTLPKEWSVECTSFYTSPSYFGTGRLKALYQFDAGIQKKFSNKKDILRLAANDIFNSGNHYRFDERLPIKGTTIYGDLNFGTVAYKLTYTHNFGNKLLKGKRDRSTGAEAELNRVHN